MQGELATDLDDALATRIVGARVVGEHHHGDHGQEVVCQHLHQQVIEKEDCGGNEQRLSPKELHFIG